MTLTYKFDLNMVNVIYRGSYHANMYIQTH